MRGVLVAPRIGLGAFKQGARLDALCEQALLRRGCDLPYREWFVRDA